MNHILGFDCSGRNLFETYVFNCFERGFEIPTNQKLKVESPVLDDRVSLGYDGDRVRNMYKSYITDSVELFASLG